MLEFMALVGILVLGLMAVAAVALIGFLLKITFKVLLFPLWLALGLLKVLIVGGLILGLLVFAPFALLLLVLVALPLLLIGGLLALGWAAVAA